MVKFLADLIVTGSMLEVSFVEMTLVHAFNFYLYVYSTWLDYLFLIKTTNTEIVIISVPELKHYNVLFSALWYLEFSETRWN